MALLVAVLAIPQPALAFCAEEPFDEVVASSDAVMVATVVDARAEETGSGIVVRLDPESVLKGSADDGQRVHVQPCGLVMIGESAREYARQMEGTRELWLLSSENGGASLSYGQIVTPRMTLHERIERARALLGVVDDSGGASQDEERGAFPLTVVLVAAAIVVIAGVVLASRRRTRSA